MQSEPGLGSSCKDNIRRIRWANGRLQSWRQGTDNNYIEVYNLEIISLWMRADRALEIITAEQPGSKPYFSGMIRIMHIGSNPFCFITDGADKWYLMGRDGKTVGSEFDPANETKELVRLAIGEWVDGA